MEIRRNDVTALPRFAELNAQWIEELFEMEDSDKRMASQPELYLQNGGSVFSAHIDGVVVGVCALKQDKNGEWELTKMAVDASYRGRGIGKALMEAVTAHAKNKMGLDRIYLLSSTKNAAAIRLYERCGWVVNHTGPHPVYARSNIGMEKHL